MSDARTAWALVGQGRWPAAEAAARQALPDPEAARALGQVLQVQNRHSEAESVLRKALPAARPPLSGLILRDLSQLIWMRTGDLGAALEPVDQALAASPRDPQLHQLRALAQHNAGDADGAAASLGDGLRHIPDDLLLLLTASHLAGERGQGEQAFAYAARAMRLAPSLRPVQERYAIACLAVGRAGEALALSGQLLATRPLDQLAIAVQATASRLLNDPRAAKLYDYEAFVRPYTIDAPRGWSSLSAFLNDLRGALEPLHTAQGHPFQQSLRNGTQVQSLHTIKNPVIQAFFTEAAKVVARYQAEIGEGDDPLRSRRRNACQLLGAWSVRLRSAGHHVSHIHPEGWLSSAFYVDVPQAVQDSDERQGWIKFGEPGVLTRPPLAAEHFVRPEPGRLVLFPSYMWHGTVPFTADEQRLTIAFDVVPAQ